MPCGPVVQMQFHATFPAAPMWLSPHSQWPQRPGPAQLWALEGSLSPRPPRCHTHPTNNPRPCLCGSAHKGTAPPTASTNSQHKHSPQQSTGQTVTSKNSGKPIAARQRCEGPHWRVFGNLVLHIDDRRAPNKSVSNTIRGAREPLAREASCLGALRLIPNTHAF